jgi:hypothetical protein
MRSRRSRSRCIGVADRLQTHEKISFEQVAPAKLSASPDELIFFVMNILPATHLKSIF